MSQSRFGVVLFPSTNWALKGESVAKRASLTVKLIPTPRHLSSDCGTALRFLWKDKDELLEMFAERNVPFDRVALLEVPVPPGAQIDGSVGKTSPARAPGTNQEASGSPHRSRR